MRFFEIQPWFVCCEGAVMQRPLGAVCITGGPSQANRLVPIRTRGRKTKQRFSAYGLRGRFFELKPGEPLLSPLPAPPGVFGPPLSGRL